MIIAESLESWYPVWAYFLTGMCRGHVICSTALQGNQRNTELTCLGQNVRGMFLEREPAKVAVSVDTTDKLDQLLINFSRGNPVSRCTCLFDRAVWLKKWMGKPLAWMGVPVYHEGFLFLEARQVELPV